LALLIRSEDTKESAGAIGGLKYKRDEIAEFFEGESGISDDDRDKIISALTNLKKILTEIYEETVNLWKIASILKSEKIRPTPVRVARRNGMTTSTLLIWVKENNIDLSALGIEQYISKKWLIRNVDLAIRELNGRGERTNQKNIAGEIGIAPRVLARNAKKFGLDLESMGVDKGRGKKETKDQKLESNNALDAAKQSLNKASGASLPVKQSSNSERETSSPVEFNSPSAILESLIEFKKEWDALPDFIKIRIAEEHYFDVILLDQIDRRNLQDLDDQEVMFLLALKDIIRFFYIRTKSVHPIPKEAHRIKLMGIRRIHLRGWSLEPDKKDDARQPTVVLLSPWNMEDTWNVPLAEIIRRRLPGHRIVSYNQRAHGNSDGEFHTTGVAESLDLIEAVNDLSRYPGVDPKNISVIGHSLGGTSLLLALGRLGGDGSQWIRRGMAVGPPSDNALSIKNWLTTYFDKQYGPLLSEGQRWDFLMGMSDQIIPIVSSVTEALLTSLNVRFNPNHPVAYPVGALKNIDHKVEVAVALEKDYGVVDELQQKILRTEIQSVNQEREYSQIQLSVYRGMHNEILAGLDRSQFIEDVITFISGQSQVSSPIERNGLVRLAKALTIAIEDQADNNPQNNQGASSPVRNSSSPVFDHDQSRNHSEETSVSNENYMRIVFKLIDGRPNKLPINKVGAIIVNKKGDIIGVGTNEKGARHAEEMAKVSAFENILNQRIADDEKLNEKVELKAAITYLKLPVVDRPFRRVLFDLLNNEFDHPMREATLIINVEPCQDCTNLIHRMGIENIVISTNFTNPKHALEGAEILDSKGMNVKEGVLEGKAISQNWLFFTFVRSPTLYYALYKIPHEIARYLYIRYVKLRYRSQYRDLRMALIDFVNRASGRIYKRKEFSTRFIQGIIDEFAKLQTISVKKIVSILGAANVISENAKKIAYQFAYMLVQIGIGVLTGGGPGIMEEGNRGAADGSNPEDELSIAHSIELPDEQGTNNYANKVLLFRKMVPRLTGFAILSGVFAYFIGGKGTMQEFFTFTLLKERGVIDRDTLNFLVGKRLNKKLMRFLHIMKDSEFISTEVDQLVELVPENEEGVIYMVDKIDRYFQSRKSNRQFEIKGQKIEREFHIMERRLHPIGPIVTIGGSGRRTTYKIRNKEVDFSNIVQKTTRILANHGISVIRTSLEGVGESILEGHGNKNEEAKSSRLIYLGDIKDQRREITSDEMVLETVWQFMRKTVITTYSDHGIYLFPGGLGTMDTYFEALTLLILRKIKPKNHMPLILIGKEYYRHIDEHLKYLFKRGVVSEELFDLYRVIELSEETPRIIEAIVMEHNGKRNNQFARSSSPLGSKKARVLELWGNSSMAKKIGVLSAFIGAAVVGLLTLILDALMNMTGFKKFVFVAMVRKESHKKKGKRGKSKKLRPRSRRPKSAEEDENIEEALNEYDEDWINEQEEKIRRDYDPSDLDEDEDHASSPIRSEEEVKAALSEPSAKAATQKLGKSKRTLYRLIKHYNLKSPWTLKIIRKKAEIKTALNEPTPGAAADKLGISKSTLNRLMKHHGLKSPWSDSRGKRLVSRTKKEVKAVMSEPTARAAAKKLGVSENTILSLRKHYKFKSPWSDSRGKRLVSRTKVQIEAVFIKRLFNVLVFFSRFWSSRSRS